MQSNRFTQACAVEPKHGHAHVSGKVVSHWNNQYLATLMLEVVLAEVG